MFGWQVMLEKAWLLHSPKVFRQTSILFLYKQSTDCQCSSNHSLTFLARKNHLKTVTWRQQEFRRISTESYILRPSFQRLCRLIEFEFMLWKFLGHVRTIKHCWSKHFRFALQAMFPRFDTSQNIAWQANISYSTVDALSFCLIRAKNVWQVMFCDMAKRSNILFDK